MCYNTYKAIRVEERLKRSWTPIIVGVLDIVEAIIYGIGPIALTWLFFALSEPTTRGAESQDGHGLFIFVIIIPFFIVGIPVGILAMIGGIYAIKRRKWGLVLAGSIAALFPSAMLLLIFIAYITNPSYLIDYTLINFIVLTPVVFAILGFVLTIISKKQFVAKPTVK